MGDAVTFDHVTFTVLAKRGRRITKIRVQRRHPKREQETTTNSKLLVLPSPEVRVFHQVDHDGYQSEETSRYQV
jgi:hypothetical protein